MLLQNLLSRADDLALQQLLGADLVRLIMLLDPKLATPQALKKLILEFHTPYGLLMSKKSRGLLLDLLPLREARILSQIIGLVSQDENLYDQLKSIEIRKNSEKERALADFFGIIPPDNEVINEKPTYSEACTQYSLFPHQRIAAREVHGFLGSENRRVILHMPTGSGKTRTAMSIVADHLRSCEPTLVIWLASSEELCEQAASEFEKAWSYLGNRNIDVIRFWGSHAFEPTNVKDGILIAGLSKTYSAVKNNLKFIVTLSGATSLVVLDEAHSAVAETYKLILDALVFIRYPNPGLLGLTATPGRTWADIRIDEELSIFFSKQKVTLKIPGYHNPVDYLVDQKYLAKVNYEAIFYNGGLSFSQEDLKKIQHEFDVPEYILNRLAADEVRNLAIINAIEELARKHVRIIVFATTVEHSDLIASILYMRGYNAQSITGKTHASLRRKIIESFKDNDLDSVKIICNFGVLTTGFDAPKISATVIARPTKSLVLYSQMVGRAIRGVKAGGNEFSEIRTVVDYNLPGFGSVAEAFNNWEDIWV